MLLAMWLVVMVRLASRYVLHDLVVVKMGVWLGLGLESLVAANPNSRRAILFLWLERLA
jgi:hypothetical protein